MIDMNVAHVRFAIGRPPAISTQTVDSDKYTHFTNNILPPALTAMKHVYMHVTTISIATLAMRSTYPDGKNFKVASQQNSLHAPYKAVRATQCYHNSHQFGQHFRRNGANWTTIQILLSSLSLCIQLSTSDKMQNLWN